MQRATTHLRIREGLCRAQRPIRLPSRVRAECNRSSARRGGSVQPASGHPGTRATPCSVQRPTRTRGRIRAECSGALVNDFRPIARCIEASAHGQYLYFQHFPPKEHARRSMQKRAFPAVEIGCRKMPENPSKLRRRTSFQPHKPPSARAREGRTFGREDMHPLRQRLFIKTHSVRLIR